MPKDTITTDEYLATCVRGGGGGGSTRGGVGQRETRRHGSKLVVPAMFAPNPEVLARRAQKDRAQKRDSAALRDTHSGGSGTQEHEGGATVAEPPVVAIAPSANRCCCEAEDCLGDVSKSQHFCSKTNRRVFAWCQLESTDETFGSVGRCVRCAAKDSRKG